MKVYLSLIAESKLKKLTTYLLENWSLKVRDDFMTKFTAKIHQISLQPKSCPTSKIFKGLYKCVITKQTTFYFRILENKNEIEIITIFDSRQDPAKLKEQLK
ncbi:MAG: type II toxin-antitoxin system RelE/ParE family toxin [Urechidicola sp.]|nr:type II toxin-antitoxin system RelE/ParE family toxin [Urechidicola sp.]